MHSQYFQVLTAIAAAPPAGKTPGVIYVWLDRTAVAWADVRYIGPNFKHFNPQLVPGNSRVAEQSKLAQVSTRIRSANPYPVRAYKCFVTAEGCWFIDLNRLESARRL